MWDLAQIAILGFPLSSFIASLAAFVFLGLYMTRGGSAWGAGARAAGKVVPLPVPPTREQQPAADDRKMAA